MLSIPFLRNRMLAGPKVLLQPRAIMRGGHSPFLKLVPFHSFLRPVCNCESVALSSLRTATKTRSRTKTATNTATTPKTRSKTATSTAKGKQKDSIDPLTQRYQSFCERAWSRFDLKQGTLEQYWTGSSSQTQFGKLVYAPNQLLLRFSGRENLVSEMEGVILRRLRRRSSLDKQNCPLVCTIGGPGLGKSRILEEVWNLVGQTSSHTNVRKAVEQSVSFKVSFGNQSILDDTETDYSLALAARILFSRMEYAFGSYPAPPEIWRQFRDDFQAEFQDISDPILWTLCFVLNHTLQSRTGQTLVYLAVDEIQRVAPAIPANQRKAGPTRTLIQDLAVLSSKLLKGGQSTVVHLAGLSTAADDIVVSESLGPPPENLLPSLVSEEAILDAFDGANYLRSDDPPEEKSQFKSSEWEEFSPVRLALTMVGGHFRSLEYLCTAFGLLDPASRDLASSQRPVYLTPTASPQGWSEFATKAVGLVGEDNAQRDEALPLMACAILNGGEYPPEMDDYVRLLKQWATVELDIGKRRFRITPMFLCALARNNRSDLFAHMSPYIEGNLIEWQRWEQMNTAHIGVRLRLWPYSSPNNPTVRELFPGEWGKKSRPTDPDCRFAVELPSTAPDTLDHTYKLKNQWPPKPTHAASATKRSAASSLLDWSMAQLEVIGVEHNSPELSEVISDNNLLETPFMTAANSVVDAFQFTNNALFLFQYKHTSNAGKSRPLSVSTVLEEYIKVQSSMQQFNDLWFLIIITNQQFNALHSQELPSNCCVIAAADLDCYFGPFATLAQRLPSTKILKRQQRSRKQK